MELENRADWGREERAESVVQVIGTAGARTGRKGNKHLLGERASGPTETKNRGDQGTETEEPGDPG